MDQYPASESERDSEDRPEIEVSQPGQYQTESQQQANEIEFASNAAPFPAAAPRDWTDRPAVRAVTFGLLALVSVALALLIWQRLIGPRAAGSSLAAGGQNAQNLLITGGDGSAPELSPLPTPVQLSMGITRLIDFRTVVPNRSRTDVITYTVQSGDFLFSIADLYGLKPETILWGNYEVLKDNPQMLTPDQVLNILPVDGTYYQWKEGDSLAGVAEFFKVEPDAILSFSGNPVDLTLSETSYGLKDGDWIVVPGGQRPIKDWGPPAISRSNPAVASYYGEGFCGAIYEGPIGYGSFVWPTVGKTISGYNYTAIHRGIDIGGAMGNAIFAADSGVVVYSGWSIYGYGNLIVIDHGNGWQTAYAHLNTIAVGCGASVGQGQVIGGLGSTGNSTGPHLHFEMVYNGSKPNPLDFVQ